jgi:hypothetical protein
MGCKCISQIYLFVSWAAAHGNLKFTQILNHQQAIESSSAVQAVKNISQIHQVDYGVSWHMAPENFQQTVWL